MPRYVDLCDDFQIEAEVPTGSAELEHFFGPDGPLAKELLGYRPRAGQLDFARMVEAAATHDKILEAEAPCGTGKTFAYTAGALLSRLRPITEPRPPRTPPAIIIVTANIALQEQLCAKDLPFLQHLARKYLNKTFTFALLKGWNNYACLAAAAAEERIPTTYSEIRLVEQNLDIIEWISRTETGDRSELPFEPDPKIWNRYSTTTEACPKKHCPYFHDCFAFRARRKAGLDADVVVTNYHLLWSHIRLATGGMSGLIPGKEVLILDECHAALDIGRDMLGGSLHRGQVLALAKHAAHVGIERDLIAFIREACMSFFDALHAYRNTPAYDIRIKTPHLFPETTALLNLLNDLHAAFQSIQQELPSPDEGDSEAVRMHSLLNRLSAQTTSITELLELLDKLHDNMVISLEGDNESKIVIRMVDVSQAFAKTILTGFKSVVLCSATALTNKSFSYLEHSLGLGPAARIETVDVPSPFDFKNQGLLVLPRNMPAEIHSKEFQEAMERACCAIAEYAHGRTLFLFTSYANMRIAGNALRRQNLVRVYQQGDMPKVQLVDAFRKDVHSVLLGVESMWTGIDVQGESLSCVVVDKLPFPNMKDPVMDALRARDERGWFDAHSVPAAIIQLKQGIGRLIRTVSDRGVAVILDPRVTAKRYGAAFLASLPEFTRTEHLSDIADWLANRELTDELPF